MASKFRTTELSNPEFESDNLRFITVKTPNLKGRGDICLYVPSVNISEDIPLVILLHGVYGSAWIWSQKAGVHRTAEKLILEESISPMLIAMPSDGLLGDGTAYLPHHSLNFEKWIVEDVIAAVQENIPEMTQKSSVYIAGLSMGGYGALRLGAKYPSIFSGISGHSSITALAQMRLFVEEPLESFEQDNEDDVSVLSTIIKNRDTLPPLRFDCGVGDELIDYNRTLHQRLKQAHIKHDYQEFSGKHEWVYWEHHVKDSLKFFSVIEQKKEISS
ncbi:prolyl oligopeptidase family serine peptidase [Tamlana fucoidanivorans]|uniref:Esterase family protein n=1 Tax=Allotamlana fucoidanivorans TaxID=2583814 RepID=A0A5C4SMM0_9FLAO|nr:alpha/beta hydrolase-fold protein [Tamlana fucoidanivorans]TNJ45336.1 esterase family protein [Tamlana fucoidanivorans]